MRNLPWAAKAFIGVVLGIAALLALADIAAGSLTPGAGVPVLQVGVLGVALVALLGIAEARRNGRSGTRRGGWQAEALGMAAPVLAPVVAVALAGYISPDPWGWGAGWALAVCVALGAVGGQPLAARWGRWSALDLATSTIAAGLCAVGGWIGWTRLVPGAMPGQAAAAAALAAVLGAAVASRLDAPRRGGGPSLSLVGAALGADLAPAEGPKASMRRDGKNWVIELPTPLRPRLLRPGLPADLEAMLPAYAAVIDPARGSITLRPRSDDEAAAASAMAASGGLLVGDLDTGAGGGGDGQVDVDLR